MKSIRYYLFICAMFASIAMAAQGGEWSVRLLGGISPAYNDNDNNPDWHIGASAEYSYKITPWFSLSPSLDVRYIHSHTTDIPDGMPPPFDEFGNPIKYEPSTGDGGDHYNAFDLRFNAIGNLTLPKGWNISTGPAIGLCAPFSCYNCNGIKVGTPSAKFRSFWAAGISKRFGKIRIGAMWYQHLNDSNVGGKQMREYFNNDLTFSIAYTL